jgi:hypothetical protein
MTRTRGRKSQEKRKEGGTRKSVQIVTYWMMDLHAITLVKWNPTTPRDITHAVNSLDVSAEFLSI